MWWRGWPAFLWWAPPMAWCPACTPTPRTPTLTSGRCARSQNKESGASAPWSSPLLHHSLTSWNLRVGTFQSVFDFFLDNPSVDVPSKFIGCQNKVLSAETVRIITCWSVESQSLKQEVHVRMFTHPDLSPSFSVYSSSPWFDPQKTWFTILALSSLVFSEQIYEWHLCFSLPCLV